MNILEELRKNITLDPTDEYSKTQLRRFTEDMVKAYEVDIPGEIWAALKDLESAAGYTTPSQTHMYRTALERLHALRKRVGGGRTA